MEVDDALEVVDDETTVLCGERLDDELVVTVLEDVVSVEEVLLLSER